MIVTAVLSPVLARNEMSQWKRASLAFVSVWCCVDVDPEPFFLHSGREPRLKGQTCHACRCEF